MMLSEELGLTGSLIVPEAPRDIFAPPPPRDTSELDRILAIPRRDPSAAIDASALDQWKRPGCKMDLREIQARALLEAQAVGGLFGLIGVGRGKTLISLLLPMVLGHKRSVLLIPTQDRSKLLTIDYPELAKHWRVPNVPASGLHFGDVDSDLFVVTYHDLSDMRRADLLERYSPTLIIGDEAHKLRNKATSTGAARFDRYTTKNRHVTVCLMSGSFMKRSVQDYAHLIGAALKERSPLPRSAREIRQWADVIDVDEMGFEAPSGPIAKLCRPGETIREAFKRRLIETPGVIATAGSPLGAKLTINARRLAIPREADEAIREMREKWRRPDGLEFEDILQKAMSVRQLACGFYYRWIYPRREPEDLRVRWLTARAEWSKEVREYLKYRRKPGMDSPGLLQQAAIEGSWKSATWREWSEVKDLVQPDTETVWLSHFLVQDAIAWGRESPGIIWFEHTAVGHRIRDVSGFPFYGDGPEASATISHETGQRTIIASIKAHHAGKNLQKFSRNLTTSPPASGDIWEQLLGRTHRDGQTRNVTFDLYGHVPENFGALAQAQSDARAIQGTTPNAQKLLYADYSFKIDPRVLDTVRWRSS